MNEPIQANAMGITVTRYTDGWPRSTVIKREDGGELSLFGAPQARGLLWALQEVIKADKEDE